MIKNLPLNPVPCLFDWAKGRKDCEIKIIKLSRGTAKELYHNGKLISIT